MQRRLRADETDDFVAEAKAAFRRHLHGRAASGPFTLIFHGFVDDDSDGPLEAILAAYDAVAASAEVHVRAVGFRVVRSTSLNPTTSVMEISCATSPTRSDEPGPARRLQ